MTTTLLVLEDGDYFLKIIVARATNLYYTIDVLWCIVAPLSTKPLRVNVVFR